VNTVIIVTVSTIHKFCARIARRESIGYVKCPARVCVYVCVCVRESPSAGLINEITNYNNE
jgi:hypothetical protein